MCYPFFLVADFLAFAGAFFATGFGAGSTTASSSLFALRGLDNTLFGSFELSNFLTSDLLILVSFVWSDDDFATGASLYGHG